MAFIWTQKAAELEASKPPDEALVSWFREGVAFIQSYSGVCLLMAGARYLVAGSVVFAWGLRGNGERPSARSWREAFLLGGLFFLAGAT